MYITPKSDDSKEKQTARLMIMQYDSRERAIAVALSNSEHYPIGHETNYFWLSVMEAIKNLPTE